MVVVVMNDNDENGGDGEANDGDDDHTLHYAAIVAIRE